MAEHQQYEPIDESPTTPIFSLGYTPLYNLPSKIFGQRSFLHPRVPPPLSSPPRSPPLSPPPPIPQDNYTKNDDENDNRKLFGVVGRSYQNIVVNTNPAPNVGSRNNNPVPQITQKLRIVLLLSSLTTVGLESFSLIFKILNPTKFVLGIYLIVLSAILFCVETHIKQIMKVLHENIGILFNGYGRSFYLLLLSSLCYASASTYYGVALLIGIFQYVVSFIYFGSACFTFYLRCKYKEDLDDVYLVEDDDIADMTKDMANNFFWTDSSVYDNGETSSLLDETR